MVEEDKLIGWGWAKPFYSNNLWSRYKINREIWLKMWGEQNGLCAGCQGELAHAFIKDLKVGLRPEVDHDHATGKVRGLLCRRCNDFLGKVKDNVDLLHRLQQYLQKHGDSL